MTRTRILEEIWRLALKLKESYNREEENKIWDLASDYNRNNDDEIFVCELHEDSEGNEAYGLYIEDGYVIFEA